MPTYAYACTTCGHRFEVQQSFSDASLTECPECEGRLRKLFNTVGIVFKGSGFYRTDSRGASTAQGSGEGSSGAKETSKESAASTTSSAPAAASSSTGTSEKAKPAAPAA